MPGGVYSALSGLQARTGMIDRLATDIANSSTPAYKAERNTNAYVERPNFSDMLNAAVDVTTAKPTSDFRAGSIAPTGRDLDVSISGEGFFALETPYGVRYTRDGHFLRSADGTLVGRGGHPVLCEGGSVRLPAGTVDIQPDGNIKVGGALVGRLQVTTFDDPTQLVRTDGVRFRAPENAVGTPLNNPVVQPQSLEQANVALPELMTQVAELARSFEALQRGMSVLINELDGRAIVELGRR